MKAPIHPFLVLGAFLAALTLAVTTCPSAAHAQGSVRIAAEAKLQIFPDSGLSITVNAGNQPVQYQQFTGTGYLSSGSGFTNNVSGGGMTTGVVTELFTGSGPGSATYNLQFNTSITLRNNTSTMLNFSFLYDVSYGANASLNAAAGTGSSSTYVNIYLYRDPTGVVSNFQDSQSSNPGVVPGRLQGTGVVFPNQSTTFAFITTVQASTQFTAAVVVPEPASLILLAPVLPLLAFGLRRRYRAF